LGIEPFIVISNPALCSEFIGSPPLLVTIVRLSFRHFLRILFFTTLWIF
jgi:hypothetical protein